MAALCPLCKPAAARYLPGAWPPPLTSSPSRPRRWRGSAGFSARSCLPRGLPGRCRAPPEWRGRAMPVGKMPGRQRLIADLWRLVEADWRNIAAGIYAAPEDGEEGALAGLRRAVDFFADLGAVEARRHGPPAEALLPEAAASRYPPYYRRKFHFQSDGYLSAGFGRALRSPGRGAVRRRRGGDAAPGAGAAASRFAARSPAASCRRGPAARYRLRHRRLPARGKAQLPAAGGHRGRPVGALSGGGAAPARGVVARCADRGGGPRRCRLPPASSISSAASISFTNCRRACAAPLSPRSGRVLKPGGTFILVNSLQIGDEPDYDSLLDWFPVAFHEPFYESYLR